MEKTEDGSLGVEGRDRKWGITFLGEKPEGGLHGKMTELLLNTILNKVYLHYKHLTIKKKINVGEVSRENPVSPES